MCGIAGFIDGRSGYSAEALARTAEAMATTLRHRGPDDAGVWTDPVAGVALAHRRLSIVDLSPAGHQPMVSSCGRLVLTYNGEIYNHAELRAELAASGRTFRGHSDTEVLVEACAAWGVEATLRRLIGMFAFAVWDRDARTMTLARDRIGLKPLYWGQFGPLFLFGSELKALRAHPGWTPGDRPREPRRLHAVGPRSLAALHLPRPAQAAARPFPGPDSPEASRASSSFWDPAQVAADAQADRLQLGEEEALERLEALLGDAVGRRMIADVPLGAFLSGGIDSALIVALMQARCSRPVNTFAIGFEEKRYDEAAPARAAAKHLGTDHAEMVVTAADALTLAPELAVLVRRAFRHPLPDPRHDGLAAGPPRGDGGPVRRRWRRAVRRLSRLPHRPGRAWGDRRSGAVAAPAVAGTADGLIAGITAVHAMIPAAYRPGMLGNKAKQITGVLRDGGGISEYYAELYSAVAELPPLVGAERRTPDALAVTRTPRHRRRPHRPHGLFRASGHAGGRNAGQVGPGQHGLRPGGARTLPGPPGRRVRLAPAASPQILQPLGQQAPAAPPAVPAPPGRVRRSSEEGLLQPHARLAARPVAGMGRGPARRAAAGGGGHCSTPPSCASAGSSTSRPPRITANCSGAS